MTPHKVNPPSQFDRARSLLRTGLRALILRFYDQARRKLTGAPVWNLSQVTPLLALGGQHYPKGWRTMQDVGVQAVVNMREAHHDDATKGIAPDHYLHVATRDNTPPTLQELHIIADFIQQQVQAERKVYVHCGVGVGRAPTALAAYFIKHEGLSTDETLQHIKRTRPFVHLTTSQDEQLRIFEHQVKPR